MTLKYIRLSIVSTLIVAGLVACRVGRNYQRPSLALPAQYNDTVSAASADSSIATLEWKQFFTDTTLQGLIGRALSGNYDLQLAIKRIETAQAYLKQAKLGWLPTVNLQAAASTSIPSKNSLNGTSLNTFLGTEHIEDYSLNAGLSWEIDVWGKIKRRKEAALASYLGTFEGMHAVQTGLVADIANSYYNLLMLDAQLEIARSNVLLSDTIVQMIRLQKTAGETTELAVQQAEAQRQTAALLIPQLEQAKAIEQNTLRILAGELPGTVAYSTTLITTPLRELMPAGVPAALLSNRPDVKEQEMALVAANAEVGVAQASMYPALNITASGGVNAFKASDWFTLPASLFGMVAGSLTQPVFQRGQLKTNLEVAKIQREEAVIRFRQVALNAIGEVSNSLVRLDKLKEQQVIASNQVTTLALATSQARMLFRSGMANYLDVITAQGRSLQASLTQADITRQQLSASVELYRSLGGGWK
ncbi:efflux transporter outer membrane subunit [Chitinophaga pinensis]|uniref:RND efflux system, outer membrane lipoprotein, NodT family n=1 Tax=Chitinophaga pinensis (strain ATCC 43595 / DSM 2588 / LMG 13176 / NBRC 15968 / NCIMB 11800 / UQM 2034) TaxID=485918 RepID=A0A979G3S7_CHIPD|nr:efflux transporter outer membrane subunit [Chitinophaga pinensis]ACU60264.1 RND efflux system, outer membrane lipoprotein, NodT family [Chitinophaga pinensis DSM 2588]